LREAQIKFAALTKAGGGGSIPSLATTFLMILISTRALALREAQISSRPSQKPAAAGF